MPDPELLTQFHLRNQFLGRGRLPVPEPDGPVFGAEEVRAVLKLLIAELEPGVMRERRRLQRVARLLPRHLRPGERLQLGIHLREQLAGSLRLTPIESSKKQRDVS